MAVPSHRSGFQRTWWTLLGVALWVGCAWRHGDGAEQSLPPCGQEARGVTPLDQCLAKGDALFSRRADPARLDGAIAVFLDALSIDHADPRTLGRLARAYATRAYARPEGAVQDYATARSMGLQCLQTDPDLRVQIQTSGGVLTNRAIGSLDRTLASCALWTADAWAHTLALGGVAGAAIDLRMMEILAERAVALEPEGERGKALAVLGLVQALPPLPLGPDLDAAERNLNAAIKADPSSLTPRMDLAEWVLARRGDAEAWRETLVTIQAAPLRPADPDLLENQRAAERAATALAAGLSDPTAWWRR